MRSRLTTYGAQHIISLSKSGIEVEKTVGEYDVLKVAKREIGSWLDEMCSDKVKIDELVAKYRVHPDSEDVHPGSQSQTRYSIAQMCEHHEQRKVRALMSREERIHIKAHSGPDHRWVTLLPLFF